MSATEIHAAASPKYRERFRSLDESTWQRLARLLDQCGERVAGVLVEALGIIEDDFIRKCPGALASGMSSAVARFEQAYAQSTLRHTDETHDDGYVRRGAEDQFLKRLELAPPR